ncbi:hypothetical protein ACQX1P_07855, partial [Corynebacterium diphtheriae]
LTLSLTEFTAWMHRETPHNLVSDFSVRIMGSSSTGGIKVKHRFSQTWQCHEQQRIRTRRNQSA